MLIFNLLGLTGNSRIILARDEDAEALNSHPSINYPFDDGVYEYHIFLSHKQLTGADLAARLKFEFHRLDPTLNIFLDVDDLNDIQDLDETIQKSKVILFLITENVFGSDYVRKEIEMAARAGKKIILVRDENTPLPSFTSIAHHFETPEQQDTFRKILEERVIPFYRQKEFRKVSLQLILQQFSSREKKPISDSCELKTVELEKCLEQELQRLCPGIKFSQEFNALIKIESNIILLLLKPNIFENSFLKEEIVIAVKEEKKIILIRDENTPLPSFSSIKHHFKTPEQQNIFRRILKKKIIPFYRQKEFRQVSLQLILQQIYPKHERSLDLILLLMFSFFMFLTFTI